MFTVDELLSKRNQALALAHFRNKKDGCGIDKMRVSELENYWKLNHQRIVIEIRNGTYEPGLIKNTEILNEKGKRREISSLNVIDRFIARLLSQKLRRYLESEFLENSYAYQENKGVVEAVNAAKKYMDSGDVFVCEIDLQSYFDTIPLEKLLEVISSKVKDGAVVELIRKYLYCQIWKDGEVIPKKQGLVQGNSISPVLSNLYLHKTDCYMEEKGYHWIRFADNINIYTSTKEKANEAFLDVSRELTEEASLIVNQNKSGIYSVFERRFLGYEFQKIRGKIEVKKHQYQKMNNYGKWHSSVLERTNGEYHIIDNGVLNKKDYALLFENEDKKCHIPVGVVNQINIYNEVTVAYSVIKLLGNKNIKLAFMDEYGRLIGHFVPNCSRGNANVFIKQCLKYNDREIRLELARKFEIAGLHNMRSNVRYYNKKKNHALNEYVENLRVNMEEMNVASSMEQLMLIEARARQKYYTFFNTVLLQEEFRFMGRTKQPPKDAINALISFGNTLLYNEILRIIWKGSLDPKIGIVHATNRRNCSLNLDFADLFKPLIVDRIIFTLVNCFQIRKDRHFMKMDNGGVYLNNDGKRIFIEEFEEKLKSEIMIKNTKYTYRQLIENEIRKYQKYVLDENDYKPYKYY